MRVVLREATEEQLRIAKEALEYIAMFTPYPHPEVVAENALTRMSEVEDDYERGDR